MIIIKKCSNKGYSLVTVIIVFMILLIMTMSVFTISCENYKINKREPSYQQALYLLDIGSLCTVEYVLETAQSIIIGDNIKDFSTLYNRLVSNIMFSSFEFNNIYDKMYVMVYPNDCHCNNNTIYLDFDCTGQYENIKRQATFSVTIEYTITDAQPVLDVELIEKKMMYVN